MRPRSSGNAGFAFSLLDSTVKPGCAETAIIDGILDLLAAARQPLAKAPGSRLEQELVR
jgi:hypothetical protein